MRFMLCAYRHDCLRKPSCMDDALNLAHQKCRTPIRNWNYSAVARTRLPEPLLELERLWPSWFYEEFWAFAHSASLAEHSIRRGSEKGIHQSNLLPVGLSETESAI